MSGHIVVLCTVPDEAVGRKIAEELLSRRQAACVNLSGPSESIYRWEGRIQREPERLLIIKTRRELFAELDTTIRRVHPYDVPEIVALPIAQGSAAYLSWIASETGTAAD